MFLTDPDYNGEQHKACVVEIIDDWEIYNKEEEKCHQLLKDLEYCTIYD